MSAMLPLETTLHELARRSAGEHDLTHDGLALGLGERWRDEARYVEVWKRWMLFEGVLWRQDDRLGHMTRARAYLREVAARIGATQKDAAKQLRKEETVKKVLSLARSNPNQAATVEQWDADPWLLGTPGGVVDLRTGELRPGRPTDYITKATACAPARIGTPAPLFERFLARVTDGRVDLQDYLQRFFGSALTGDVRDHVLPFAYGVGSNGKSVLLNTISGLMNEYAVTIATEMLMVSHNDRHPEELARLRGVRLAVGSETEEGTRWAEARIKRLTGGDPITARYMRQNTFEFRPTFKLLISGNRRPSLGAVDEAIRRRVHLLPFDVIIPPEERDLGLTEKLKAEWPAILRWCIEGCLKWQTEGLRPPESVRSATDDYLESEDAIALWLEESFTRDPNGWASNETLFASWAKWAQRTGEAVGSQKRLTGALKERKFAPGRKGGDRGFGGLRVKEAPVADEPS